MATRRFRFLPYDMTRCFGVGCKSKARCDRHKQIELDKEADDGVERRIPYTTTLIDKDTDTCDMRIEYET